MTARRAGTVFVPHFHWDREWYEPFQVFRFRLVEAMDAILDIAEAEPAFRFTADGQSAALEDYLEIRPEHRERVRAAVARGQLAAGPWFILLDEFLSSGETIVRNLQLGWRSAEHLGGAMRLGYLPDMFGHVAQMPQILARAGIEHAALWRGVPQRIDGHAFRWTAPDGSSVRTEYLFDGYGNGLDLLLVPEEIPHTLQNYQQLTADRWGGDPVLAMAGTDHLPPDPKLMEWLRRFDSDVLPLAVATVLEYVTEHTGAQRLHEVVGELRSHARGNILPGVLSIRRPLKTAMAIAERTAGEAERLSAAWSDTDPRAYLDLAWRKIIESSAHDSVVGSGTDETVEQVHARLAEAAQLARAVRDGALAEIATSAPGDAVVVANVLTSARTIVIEAEAERAGTGRLQAVAADGSLLPTQMLRSSPRMLADEQFDAADVARVLRRIHRRELFGLLIDHVDLEPGSLTFHLCEQPGSETFDLLDLTVALHRALERRGGVWRVRTLAAPRDRVAVAVPVPASGIAAVRLVDGGDEDSDDSTIVVGDRMLRNDLVTAHVADDGTLEIRGADGTVLHGVGRLVDGGDRGDTYNYGPPARDRLVDRPVAVTVEVVERGPVRGRLRVTRTYEWPLATTADRTARTAETAVVTVETLVEVHEHEPFVRMTVSFVNPARDHRVRVHIPLPQAVDRSWSEGQFAVTGRGLCAEGGWGEFPLPTYPASSFVTAGAATVLLDEVTEYEVVGDGSELALTLLRAVGSISVNLHPLRDEPAASEIPVPGAQEIGSVVSSRFAVLPHSGGWATADAPAMAERFRSPGLRTRGTAPTAAALPANRTGLEVRGRGVSVSSVRSVEGGVEVRLVALSDDPTTATVRGRFDRVTTVDLLGRPLHSQDSLGVAELALGPWEIRSLVLT